MNNNNEALNSCIDAISICKANLDKIAGSCCMPERSPNMQAAFRSLQEIETTIKHAYEDNKFVEQGINKIGELGSKVGFLFATCCTSDREILYQNIFKQLNKTHEHLWGVLGHSH